MLSKGSFLFAAIVWQNWVVSAKKREDSYKLKRLVAGFGITSFWDKEMKKRGKDSATKRTQTRQDLIIEGATEDVEANICPWWHLSKKPPVKTPERVSKIASACGHDPTSIIWFAVVYVNVDKRKDTRDSPQG